MESKEKYTVSKISRLCKVNRNMVYRILEKKYGRKVTMDDHLTEEDYLFVKNHYEEKEKAFEDVKKASSKASTKSTIKNVEKLGENSTLKKRLQDAKDKYYWNECLIADLQEELANLKKEQGNYIHITSTGSMAKPPQLEMIEKYQKLQSLLNKDINALEEKLHLYTDDEDSQANPFDI